MVKKQGAIVSIYVMNASASKDLVSKTSKVKISKANVKEPMEALRAFQRHIYYRPERFYNK